MFLRQRAQALHEFFSRWYHAAFALYRLQHDRHRMVADQGLDTREVVQLRLREARHLRSEHGVPAGLTRCRHRRQCAAMKAVLEGDDLVAIFAGSVRVQLTPLARELDRAFVRFRATIGEEHAIEAGVLGQHRR